MGLDHWREFITFSQYMSVSEAARHLHISQPTLSNHLAALERELGAQLFTREKPLRLTPAGRLLVHRGAEVLEAYDKALAAIHDAPEQDYALTVFVNDGPNCGLESFRYLVNRFVSENPFFQFKTVASFEKTASGILRDRSIDCVVALLAPQEADLAAGIAFKPLPIIFPNRLGIWVSERSPLAQRESLKWEDLNGLTFPVASLTVPLWIEGLHQSLRNHGVTYDYRVLSSGTLGVLSEVREGEVLLLDEYASKTPNYTSVPGYVFIPIDEPDAVSEAFIAYRPDRVSRALDLFLDFIGKQGND